MPVAVGGCCAARTGLLIFTVHAVFWCAPCRGHYMQRGEVGGCGGLCGAEAPLWDAPWRLVALVGASVCLWPWAAAARHALDC